MTKLKPEQLGRYRELVNLMLAEAIKGSPLFKHTDKTYIALTVSRIAYGAVVCESDPMGQGDAVGSIDDREGA